MKKNILMVHNYYQIGGGEHTVFENEVKMLRDHGYNVTTYTRNNNELKTSVMKKLLLPFTVIWSFKTHREVQKLIKTHNIDIVHCHNTFPLISPSVYYAARSMKVPVVQTIHNYRFLCANGIFYRNNHICEECNEKWTFWPAVKYGCYRNSKIDTLILTNMLGIHRLLGTYNKISYVFLSEFSKKKFRKLIDEDKVDEYIKPNFTFESKTNSQNKLIDEKQKVFIFAGRLEENKGIRFLADNWLKFPTNYQLHVYGDGTLVDYIDNKTKFLPNIKFFSFQTKETILADMKNATALLFPSQLYEGYPMIIVEAFSVGLPVVATNLGNQREIVTVSHGGVLYSSNDINSFTQAVLKVVEDYASYSANAIEYYRNKLSEASNYLQLEEIYDKVKHIH